MLGIMQAVIYCRVSTLGQGEDGISLEMQEARARAWCVANGYSVEAVLTETVSGGRMANRPQLQRALQLVCKTRGVLVVFSLSRLSRSLSDTICIAARLERARANLASLTERIDTASAIGNLFFRLIAAMNEFEKDQVGERTRSALAHLRRQGRHISARVPFGYDVAGNMLVANATEQVGLAHIVGWHAEA